MRRRLPSSRSQGSSGPALLLRDANPHLWSPGPRVSNGVRPNPWIFAGIWPRPQRMSRPSPVRLLSVCLALLVLVSGCVRAVPGPDSDPPDAEVMARIRDWEDRRSLGDGQLVALVTGAEDPRVRARALRALARIQDVATLDAVVAGLKDSEALVRGEAAFAAGELALSWEPLTEAERASLATPLLAAEEDERDAAVRAAQLDS